MNAYIFDLDGTLVDTLESICYSVNETLEEMGMPRITAEQCELFIGDGARILMERALMAAGDEKALRIEEGMRIYGRIFDDNCTYHVTPYKGIEQVIACLQKEKVKLGVLSNKPHEQTVKVVEAIFGTKTFVCVQGQQEAAPKKPDPEGIFHILAKMGEERSQCLYVGDSEVDIRTGKNAGVKSVSVTWGFRSREALVQAGAEFIVDTPEELLSYRGAYEEKNVDKGGK